MYQTTDNIPDLMFDILPAYLYVWDTTAMQPTTTISTVAARSESEPQCKAPTRDVRRRARLGAPETALCHCEFRLLGQ